MAGYWVVHIDVSDESGYMDYVHGSTKVVAQYGGEFVARGARYTQKEGRDYPRNVMVRFPTYERALEAYESDEYQAIVGQAMGTSERQFTIIEAQD